MKSDIINLGQCTLSGIKIIISEKSAKMSKHPVSQVASFLKEITGKRKLARKEDLYQKSTSRNH